MRGDLKSGSPNQNFWMLVSEMEVKWGGQKWLSEHRIKNYLVVCWYHLFRNSRVTYININYHIWTYKYLLSMACFQPQLFGDWDMPAESKVFLPHRVFWKDSLPVREPGGRFGEFVTDPASLCSYSSILVLHIPEWAKIKSMFVWSDRFRQMRGKQHFFTIL